MKRILNILLITVLFTALLAACNSTTTSTGGQLRVLATTTFLADITRNVAGDRAQVDSLLPIGADPHSYQATPTDVARIAKSNVLVQNGIGYEIFLGTLLENAGGERLIITASEGLKPRQLDKSAGTAESATGHGNEAGDPHMWLDPNLVITYVENIRDGLIKADPEGTGIYRSNADEYISKLKALDTWIVEQVKTVPTERRLLVTNHEALGYFADRYGFRVIGAIIPSLSTEASPSAQSLADIIDQIKASGAPAIFLGDVENPDLASQIAAETGIKVVNDLHLESLTDGAPAATYLDLMKYNVTRIVEALR